jgi:hypothetical protein
VLLEETTVAATLFQREPGGVWIASAHTGGELLLPGPDITIPLPDLYRGLTFRLAVRRAGSQKATGCFSRTPPPHLASGKQCVETSLRAEHPQGISRTHPGAALHQGQRDRYLGRSAGRLHGLSKQGGVRMAVEAALDKDAGPIPVDARLRKLWAENPLPPPAGKRANKTFFDDLSGEL